MKELIVNIMGEDKLSVWIVFISLTYISVLVCMVIDLFSGIHKAKQNGVARTSTGFKKTSEKAGKYFMPMVCLTVIDMITMPFLPFPVLTMAMGLWNDFCEFKSVMEKAYEKKQLMDAANTFDVILKNKDDIQNAIMHAVIEGMKQSAKEKREK